MNSFQNRREFLKKSAAGALGITILPSLYGKIAPSDRLRIAHIGVGGMGNNHMQWFANLPEVEIAALCDVDGEHLASSLKNLESLQPGKKVKGYKDFRHVLDRDDIDAVTCATPDHWHAQVAILAFQAGKDVYGEKPLSYDAREGQQMLAEMKKYNRVFQLGTQKHATENYHRIVEILRSEAIGKVHTVRLWKPKSIPEFRSTDVQPPPEHLNWDMWLGPAPYTEYIPARCHRTYRYFFDYSGGEFADFWCHIADIVFWSLQPQGLKKINARGESLPGIADTPEWIHVDLEFDDLNLHWTTEPPNIPGAKERWIGAYFEGDKGTLICDYETREITINGEKMTDIEEVPKTIDRSPGHQQNFVDSVKTRTQPASNLEYARIMTLPMHLGLISYRLERELEWDENNEQFLQDDEANALLHRTPRNKWNLIG